MQGFCAVAGAALVLAACCSCCWAGAPCRAVAVLGGTGSQGRALIEDFTADATEGWAIRALTRNSKSKAAVRLARLAGVTVVEGSYLEAAALAELFDGACAAFLVTFTDFEGFTEVDAGRAMMDAAHRAGVQTVVFSGGPFTGVPFLDAKHDIEEYAKTKGFGHAVFLHSGFFFDNLVFKGGRPRLGCEHKTDVTLSSPFPGDYPVNMHSARSLGLVAAAVLRGDDAMTATAGGRTTVIPIAGQRLSCNEYAAAVNTAAARLGHGFRAKYHRLSLPELRALIPGPTGVKIADMYARFIGGSLDFLNSAAKFAAAREASSLPEDLPGWLEAEGLAMVQRICDASTHDDL